MAEGYSSPLNIKLFPLRQMSGGAPMRPPLCYTDTHTDLRVDWL